MSEETAFTETWYVPGSWVGMAAANMWLVADLDQRDPVIAACWSLVAEASTVDQVLTTLLEARLRPALNLAVVRLDDRGAEIVVRGAAWAEIADGSSLDNGPTELRAGSGSFRDAMVDRFSVINLYLPVEAPDEGGTVVPGLTLGSGVVPVSRLTIYAGDSATTGAPPEPRVTTDEVPEAGPATHAAKSSGGRFDAMFGKTMHPAEEEQQTAAVPQEWMAGMRLQFEPPMDSKRGERSTPDDFPHRFGDRPAGEAPTDLFTDVSWATVTDARSAEPDPDEQYHAMHPAPADHRRPVEVPSSPPAGRAHHPMGGIDPELLQTVQRSPSTPATAGPVVSTVRCGAGHLNPPEGRRCRICGGGIPSQTPQSTPRPSLGLLRLSTGEIVPLDRGVILGRAPGAPEGFGRDEPYRIQLPNPDGSISRRHVEVVLQGWSVAVVDLKSTNGTEVTPPGGVPERLPPGGRRIIDDGWTVSLDAATYFRFEVTE